MRFKQFLPKDLDDPHLCRHYHLTEAQGLGVSNQIAKDQAGHADISMTSHYTHLDLERRREMYEKSGVEERL